MEGNEAQIEEAFLACIDEIDQRAHKLKSIAEQKLDRDALKQALADMGVIHN